jgi:lipoprotein-anchoring transpeptidase ErfK/SrfK
VNDSRLQMTGHRATRWRGAAVLLAVLVPALPVLAGLLIPARSAGAGAVNGAALRPATPTPPASSLTRAFPAQAGTLVALVTRPTTMHVSPGGRTLARVPLYTGFGSPEAMWVRMRTPGWLGVVSPLAGNGRIGWIPESAASLSRVPWQIKVSLAARRLTVLDAGRVMAHFTVAIGRPDAPTPRGSFAVTDRLETGDPTGPYGCCILALSAEAPHAIQGWNGGNRIAIHSTPETSSIGLPVSHGCLRLTLAQGRWLMNHIPLGTPTLISS